MKKNRSKLTLHRETLHRLHDQSLPAVRGGAIDTDGVICSVDTCHPTCRDTCGCTRRNC